MNNTVCRICVGVFFCLLVANCTAANRKSTIHINGIISGVVTRDSAELLLFNDVLLNRANRSHKTYKAKIENGRFYFILEGIEGISYILLNAHNEPNQYPQYYLIEPEDSLFIKVKGKEIVAEGAGSVKFECLNELNKINPSTQELKALKVIESRNLYEYYIKRKDVYNKVFGKRDSLLTTYKSRISDDVYHTLRIDAYSTLFQEYYNVFDYYLNRARESSNSEVMNVFCRIAKEIRGDNTEFIMHEMNALGYLYSRSAHDLYYKKELIAAKCKSTTSSYSFRDLFFSITGNFTGVLRDKLILTLYLNTYNTQDEAALYIDSAMRIISNPAYKAVLNSMSSFALGKDAYDFQLTDSLGISHRLSDFQGKVIVLEFWIPGCPYCAAFSKGMNRVVEHFRGNDSVKFITVSVAKDTAIWKKALKEGKYTSPGSLDLFSQLKPRGRDDLSLAYNLRGYPSFMVIDQRGRIISINPTRPIRKEPTEAFIRFVEQQLRAPLKM